MAFCFAEMGQHTLLNVQHSIVWDKAVVGRCVETRALATKVTWARSLPFMPAALRDIDELLFCVETGWWQDTSILPLGQEQGLSVRDIASLSPLDSGEVSDALL